MLETLNDRSARLCDTLVQRREELQIQRHSVVGATVWDFGVHVPGSLEAGILLAKICMADLADICLTPGSAAEHGWHVTVQSNQPVMACLASQYAGWPVELPTEDGGSRFFAMGSGPMRIARGREPMLVKLGLHASGACPRVVGVLECNDLPSDIAIETIAQQCGVAPEQMVLCIAPVTSLAGTIQVVARSVETALHKIFDLGFDLNSLISASGVCPLPTPAKPGDVVGGIGRTNDAILYGGHVTLWMNGTVDGGWEDKIAKIPSNASNHHGQPFAEIFRQNNFDFYAIDPGLFSPAKVSIVDMHQGRTYHAGESYSNLTPQ